MPAAALIAAALLAGPLRADAERTATKFAVAVARADIAAMCAQLAGEARRQQGCGKTEADLGPLLNLAIDCKTDIRVVSVTRSRARAEIPSAGVPGYRKGSRRPQRVELRRRRGAWKVTRLRLVHPSTTPASRRPFRRCRSSA